MTYPQPQYAQPGYGPPQQPPQGYYQQPQQYAQPQGYPPQQPPAFYPPQQPQPGYGPPQQPQGPPLVQGSLEAFDNQRGASFGKGLKFPVPGTQFLVRVARDITDGDVRQMTDFTTKVPVFNSDGSAKMHLAIPGVITPNAEHPTGGCTLYIKPGAWRDEYNRALAEAGVTGHAKAGSVIYVLYAGQRATGFGSPAKVPQMVYYTPESADQTLGPVAPPLQPIDAVQQPPQPQYQQPQYQQPQYQQPQYQQPAAPPQPQYQQPPQQPAYAPPAPAQAPQPQYQQQPAAQQYAMAPHPTGQPAQQVQLPQPPAPQQAQYPPATAGVQTGDPTRDALMARLTGYGQPQG